MFKKIPLPVSCLLMVVFSIVCCSIKENRSECPCLLILDLSDNSGIGADIWVSSGNDFLYHDKVGPEDIQKPYVIEVPKSRINLNVYSLGQNTSGDIGMSGYTDANYIGQDASFKIPYGEDCPPVHMFCKIIEIDSEVHKETVSLNKNYCRINLKVVAKTEYPEIISMNGKICGYGNDGQPKEGDFYFEPEIDSEGYCSICVPRQQDGSLRLSVSNEKGVLRDFSVGEYIIASGYDWSAENLEDIEMVIDYASISIVFTVFGWENTFSTEVII